MLLFIFGLLICSLEGSRIPPFNLFVLNLHDALLCFTFSFILETFLRYPFDHFLCMVFFVLPSSNSLNISSPRLILSCSYMLFPIFSLYLSSPWWNSLCCIAQIFFFTEFLNMIIFLISKSSFLVLYLFLFTASL